MAMWEGRFKKELDSKVNIFNSSISIDKRLYKHDIIASIAHTTMLGENNIISKNESEKIINGLKDILSDLEKGNLLFNNSRGDIKLGQIYQLIKAILLIFRYC